MRGVLPRLTHFRQPIGRRTVGAPPLTASMSADLTIRRERPDQPAVVALLNRGLALAALETGGGQIKGAKLRERCGYALCAPFGGYPDNSGLSLFMAKPL